MIPAIAMNIKQLAICLILSMVSLYANPTIKVVKKVSNSVVKIRALSGKNEIAQGSGVVIGDGKTIITNLHVVQSATKVLIEFPDGRVLRSKGYIAVNPNKDLITIKLPKKIKNIIPVKIEKLIGVTVGEKVIAIGSPKGFTNTVSEGIISAIRKIDNKNMIIQTTAPVSPGSSGGGLFNKDAKLIGITSFIYTDGQNLNFAYPADDIVPLIKRIDAIPFYDLQRISFNSDSESAFYITKSGKKYHKSGCRHLRKSKIKISISKAEQKGYSACGNCLR